jgi:hypothetical protein
VKKFLEKPPSPILEEARRLTEMEEHEHFHHIVEFPKLPESDRPVCFICHSELPHSKTKKVRALLNMHTQYLACETCHIEKKADDTVVYQWYSPLDRNPKGPFMGTEYHPETGYLVDVEDKFSKITPFSERDGQLLPAVQAQDAPKALDYMKVRDRLTPEQREAIKNQFHVGIRGKGHDCQTCHAEKGLLDLQKLGFSEKRIVDLAQLNIKGLLTKYEEFYLPDLLKEETEPKKP